MISVYNPAPTCAAYMKSDAKVKAIIGPLGSGKSTAAIMELFRRSVEQEPDANGIRPTRMVCVRNTAAQLRLTTIADTMELFPFANWKVSTQTIQFRMTLPDHTFVHSDWLMMPLERPEDQRKLLSLQLTGAFIEECREVPYDIVYGLRGRLGRYPSKARVKPTWKSLILVSNPWSESSEWHEHLVIRKPQDWDFFHQPGGLEPEAENVENLPENYYENLMDGASQEFINVHVHSMFGEDQFGQAVFKASFSHNRHIHQGPIRANPELPIIIGMDFGRTPCAILMQKDVWGRVLVLKEITTDDMSLHQFCQELLMPYLREHYFNFKIFVVGDPAGAFRTGYNDETAFSVLEEYGLDAVPAPTNDPDRRIRCVEKVLLSQFGERAGFMISATECPRLVEALMRGYRYKKKRDGALEPTPEKNEASHPADALQYGCLGLDSNYVGRKIAQRTAPLQRRTRRFSARAWT